MKWPVRKLLAVLGVSAVAIFVAFPPAGEPQVAAPVVRNGMTKSPVQAAAGAQQSQQSQQVQMGRIELERLNPQKSGTGNGKAISNAFKSTSWYIAPPAPPPPPPPVPPAPTAPPLPFTYMGRYEDPPKRLVILAAGSKVYTVSEGEVIEGNYRVEHVTDSAVDLVYLPLNITQSVSTMGAPENPQHRLGFAERYRRP